MRTVNVQKPCIAGIDSCPAVSVSLPLLTFWTETYLWSTETFYQGTYHPFDFIMMSIILSWLVEEDLVDPIRRQLCRIPGWTFVEKLVDLGVHEM